MEPVKYNIILPEPTKQKLLIYKEKLESGQKIPGHIFLKLIQPLDLPTLKPHEFLQKLLETKRPMFSSYFNLIGDGSDWNEDELSILGDISIAIPVHIFDNGVWSTKDKHFKEHYIAEVGELLYTSGPILARVGHPDAEELIENKKMDEIKYNDFIKRRLHPLFMYINGKVQTEGKKALITIPSIGCGVFAGEYKSGMAERLEEALKNIFTKYGRHYTHICYVVYCPYNACSSKTKKIGNIVFKVMPNEPMLCLPVKYQNGFDKLKNYKLFKIVASDPLGYPGSDYFKLQRATDNGVSAAATDALEVFSNIKGIYNKGQFRPFGTYQDWYEAMLKENIKVIATKKNIIEENVNLTDNTVNSVFGGVINELKNKLN